MQRIIKLSEGSNGSSLKAVEKREQLSLSQRLIYIFTNPSKVFEDIKENSNILLPIIIISIVTFIGIIVGLKMPNSQVTQEMGESMDGLLVTGLIIGGILTVLGIIGITALKSLVINGTSVFFGGEQTEFKKVLSSLLYATIPASIGGMILLLIGFGIGAKEPIDSSISLLMPESMNKTFVYIFLNHISVFTVWNQILNIIGVSKVNSLSKKNSTILLLAIWLVTILISSIVTLAVMNKSAGL